MKGVKLLKTALYNLHKEMGGKMIPFSGYLLPVYYLNESIKSSCIHTRRHVSLFDTSHMGQIRLYGKDRIKMVEDLTVCDAKEMKPTHAKLTLFTNPSGGIIDDCIVTIQESYIQLVVNAANKFKDIHHLQNYIDEHRNHLDVHMEVHDDKALLALQGPKALSVLQRLVSEDLNQLRFMQGIRTTVNKIPNCTLTRCGYTGEDGFEISVENKFAESLAQKLLSSSTVHLAGLGARDALRLEAGLCLHGHDCNETTTPIEASLAWTIGRRRRKEGKFLGSEVILHQLKTGCSKRRVGLKIFGASAREGALIKLVNDDKACVGYVTSGMFSPNLNYPIAMGYVHVPYHKTGHNFTVETHNRQQKTQIVKMPFVPTSYYYVKDQ